MGHTWSIHGAYMGHTWGIHGAYMGHTWGIHGAYMEHTWGIHGAYMGHTWGIHGAYMGHTLPGNFFASNSNEDIFLFTDGLLIQSFELLATSHLDVSPSV